MNNVKIIPNNKEIIRVHNNFINSIFSLSTDAKKLLLVIWLHTNSDEDIEIYQKDIQDKIGMDIMHLNPKHREEIIEELMTKIVTIRDIDNPNNFTKIQLLRDTKYKDGLLKANISPTLLPYIQEAKEKLFTRFNIQSIKPLKSGYAIRIYLMCKQFQDTGFYKNTIEEFKKQLEIEYKYKQVSDLKKRVLEVAKKQINKNTDIIVDYELEKKGRSYTHIKFKISKNPNYKEPEQREEVSTTPPAPQIKNKTSNNWNEWRKNLLEKGDVILILKNEIYKLKNGYLFKNDKLLSSEESLKIWQNLYENRDKLQIKTEDEYLQEQIKKAEEQENKYTKLNELKEKYDGKTIFGQPSKNQSETKYTITTIQFRDDNKIELYLEDYNTKEKSVTIFPDLNILERFLEDSHNAYLKTKEIKLRKNENEDLFKKINELKNKYIKKNLLIEIDKNESIEAEVIDIKINKSNIYLYLKIKKDEEIVESFDLNSDEINRLENFLEICNKAYLEMYGDDIKRKLSSIINKF